MARRSLLKEYNRKRHFDKTREPKGERPGKGSRLVRPAWRGIFVIQQHHARRLHWDFRIEHEGVLKSWAVTREPSMTPSDRHLAIETEDHPMEYARFHGEIPKGEYGGGKVLIWDRGTFTPKEDTDLGEMLERGLVEINLKGKRLTGRFVLVRTRGDGTKSQWLFFKAKPKVASLKVPEVEALPKRKVKLRVVRTRGTGEKSAVRARGKKKAA